MENYNKKSYQLIYFLIISLFLASCSSTSGLLKPYLKNNIDITDNFTIEGKFKLSMLDSKETGYFFLKKTRNIVKINIGKNYLLPEEELLLNIREDLDIKKLISKTNKDKLDLNFNTINVGDFVKLITGHEADLSSYADLEVFRDFNEREKVLPTKVKLKTANYELIILNKTIYE